MTSGAADAGFWKGRRIFLTGHTGFKGGWLALWLRMFGAEVHGYALAPPTRPSLFEVARVEGGLAGHTLGDIRDLAALRAAVVAAAPEVVFHLAAQPLVRQAYREPLETYGVNVMGTACLLEAVRGCPEVRVVVNVTTDKCYDNLETDRRYAEADPLGGCDPYSSSKACAEILTAAWRTSYLSTRGVAVATARTGNVIGGGDWAADRLLPDFFRAVDAGHALAVRHPGATRPWQHVLDPLAGYLLLAEHLMRQGQAFAGAWNFGPAGTEARPVGWILDWLARQMPGACWQADAGEHPHEAQQLGLDSDKAMAGLGWRPRWDLPAALDRTLLWHQAWRAGADMAAFSRGQIADWEAGVA